MLPTFRGIRILESLEKLSVKTSKMAYDDHHI
jgi:hypothetical protein